MKIRRGPEVERIINDPPPPSDSEANNEKVSYSIQDSIKLSFEVSPSLEAKSLIVK